MRANRPVASAKAKPRTAYEKSWPAIDGIVSMGRYFDGADDWASILTSESRVARDTIDERAKDSANSDTGTRKTDGGGTGSVHLGSRDQGRSGRLDDDAPRLHGTANHGGGERVATAIEKQAVAASSLAGGDSGDDGAWDAS